MELDIRLIREGEQPWGFELLGGADYEIPLTISKVYPHSPASIAGLQTGDIVARIGDSLATELSLEAAVSAVGEAIGSLALGVCRGLYDPVLDEYEPIYETEPADSDRRSETEVTNPTPYETTEISLESLNDYLDSGIYSPLPTDRSLTESPFVPNTKPYRPFSTEPITVPPIEDPIILNPIYKDQFYKPIKVMQPEEDELLRILPLEKNVEAKFKLPVSEKYDPNWARRVAEMLAKIERGEFVCEENKNEFTYIRDEKIQQDVQMKEMTTMTEVKTESTTMTKEEVQFDEVLSKKIDMEKIERTALDIVEESIERAVSVTEEIKKEVEEELNALKKEVTVSESKETEINQENYFNAESKLEDRQLNIESNTMYNEEQVFIQNKSEQKIVQDQKRVKESKVATKKEIEESAKRKCSVYGMSTTEAEKFVERKSEQQQFDKTKSEQSMSYEQESSKIYSSGLKTDEKFKSSTFNNTAFESEGKQKAFMIGLQTIPHIKGFVQSSYHFDLLLRTFFVHLTDVMVALSRFILTQPTTELEGKSEKVIQEKLIKDLRTHNVETLEKRETAHTQKEESKTLMSEVRGTKKEHKEAVQTKHDVQKIEQEERVHRERNEEEKRRKTGSEMALMSGRKSTDLAQKMEAVITEFETKTGKEKLEINEIAESRRSRSRSRIEEEVLKESDPLEWLDKVDSRRASQERTDITTVKKGFSSFAESKQTARNETHESREVKTTKTKPNKQMYIAVVESHVYTNKDAIIEDQAAEISETASVQSAEEIQAAIESLEAVSSENVAISNIVSEEKQQAVEVISNALESVVQEKQEILEAVSDFKHTEQHSKIEESHVQSLSESTYVSKETNQQVFEAKESKSAMVVSKESYESESKTISQQAITKQEHLASIAAETTEVISESELELLETKKIEESKAVVKSEETYKTATVEFEEVVLEATNEVAIESQSKHTATEKQELLTQIALGSTEINTDDSKVELFESEKTETSQALVSSEESFRTAAINIVEVPLEASEEKILEFKTDTEQAAMIEEAELFTAKVTEAKTDFCKKPTEDENASLKIIKHELVDAESSSLASIKQQSIKKSLHVSSHESHETYSSLTESNVQSSYQSVSDSNVKRNLHLRTDLAQQTILEVSDENNNTPSPSTVPPTPLTDEYVFKLVIPMPKSRGTTPAIEEPCEDEDPHIVKKKLVPHIETTIEEQIIYDPPLPTPEEKVQPVYTKPGLKGGEAPVFRKEYIREIERKSSLLASAIDETIKSIETYKEEVGIDTTEQKINGERERSRTEEIKEEIGNGIKECVLPGFKPVVFNPEAFQANLYKEVIRGTSEIEAKEPKVYVNESGQPLGTVQGIIDGLEEATVDEEVAKELGKPGITEDKIAELISGESEMLREAHVMGLTRVLTSHMTRPDDSSVDFQQIKPLVPSLKDSEVIKLLNEEIKRAKSEERKQNDKKWTTFMQKPQRPVPRAKFGYHGYVEPEKVVKEEPYKVKIVKQPKPKVAPDYKPEDFDTGPLPWEERALTEPPPPPIEPEDPILIPEETPEFLEAVDPLPESEVPDLEDTGIPLPKTPPLPEAQPEVQESPTSPEPEPSPVEQSPIEPSPVEPKEMPTMDQERMAEQLVNSVKSMVDPKATIIEQQLIQMRAQLAALAQLPTVIQQSLEILTAHLTNITLQESHESHKKVEFQEVQENPSQNQEIQNVEEDTNNLEEQNMNTEDLTPAKSKLTVDEYEALEREEEAALEEQRRIEKMKKVETWNQIWPWADSETNNRQYRINFMKYEKPPVNLDHLQKSEVYKLVHGMDQQPLKRVELLTPVVAEADYRERCRSATPMINTNGYP